MEAKTTHNVYDEQGNVSGVGTFDKDEMESEGTKKSLKCLVQFLIRLD